MTNEKLREEVRLLKARYRIPYNYVALRLGVKASVFYNWLNDKFEYSEKSRETIEKVVKMIIEEVERK